MIEANDIYLAKLYCTNRVKFLQQFHTLAKERKIKRSSKNLANLKTMILGPRATKIFEPDSTRGPPRSNENQKGAVAAGLEHWKNDEILQYKSKL